MGVSGSGKTTLGKALASFLDCLFLEGDAFHSKRNKDKMKKGIPLNDKDRLPWLKSINKALIEQRKSAVVLACSALKESYRKLLMDQLPIDKVVWVALHCEYALLEQRMKSRTHFMPVSLLKSQLKTLEPLQNAIQLNSSQSVDKLITQLKPYLNEK